MRKFLAFLLLLPALSHAEITLYGIDIPDDVQDEVDIEMDNVERDAARYIERHRRLKKYRDAVRQVEKDKAIDQYRHERFPQYSPDLVLEQRHATIEFERARKKSLHTVSTSMETVDVDPMNPAVHQIVASTGEPTRLIFFDHTGAPWPAIKVRTGKENRFKASIVEEIEAQNQISIELQDNFVEGNVLVDLQGYAFPIVVRVVASQTHTTSYANFRIARAGPNAEVSYQPVAGIADTTHCSDVNELLENTSIRNAHRRYLAGLPGQVWVTSEHTYIRSPFRLVFPFGSCQRSDGNGNYAARIDGDEWNTATFVGENGTYKTVRILDAVGG